MLQLAKKLRDERRAETTAHESRIDIGKPEDGKPRRGIYRLEGNLLTICYDGSGEGRPETFVVNKPSESLIILKPGFVIIGPTPSSAINKPEDPNPN